MHAAATGDRLVRLRVPYLRAQVDWVRVCAMSVRGDLAPAADLLEARRRADPGKMPEQIAVSWVAALARLRRQQGNHHELRGLVRSSSEATLTVGPEAAFSDALIAVPQAELPIAEGRPNDAIGLVATTGTELRPVLDRAIDVGSRLRAARAARAVLVPDARPAGVNLGTSGATLSSREVEVLRLIAAGHSNAQIAGDLVLSVNTVKTHVRSVLRKLGVPMRTAAASVARKLGIGDGLAGAEHNQG